MCLDMLDDFSAMKLASKEPEAAPSGPGRPSVAVEDEPGLEDELSEEDFAKHLQAGMADLLGGMDDEVSLFCHALFLPLFTCGGAN